MTLVLQNLHNRTKQITILYETGNPKSEAPKVKTKCFFSTQIYRISFHNCVSLIDGKRVLFQVWFQDSAAKISHAECLKLSYLIPRLFQNIGYKNNWN
jgi:hypothetical protein